MSRVRVLASVFTHRWLPRRFAILSVRLRIGYQDLFRSNSQLCVDALRRNTPQELR